MRTLTVWVPVGFPDVHPGDDLPRLIPEIFRFNDVAPEDLDVLVVAQKVVSKAEGSVVNLDEITPGPRAVQLAEEAKKDPACARSSWTNRARCYACGPGSSS